MQPGFCSGREEEIRTLDTVTRILPFQGSSFNHSDTSLFECAKITLFSKRTSHAVVCSPQIACSNKVLTAPGSFGKRPKAYISFVTAPSVVRS